MAATNEQFYLKVFSSNVYNRVQQFGSRIRGTTLLEPASSTAYQMFIKQYGARNGFSRVTQRLTPVNATTTPRRNTVLTADQWSTREYFTNEDELRSQFLEPNSQIMRAIVADDDRLYDDTFLDAVLGSVNRGAMIDSSLTSVALGSGQQIAVDFVETGAAANSDLTLGKIREAKRILDANEVPPMDRFIAMTSTQENTLLRQTEMQSRDFTDNTTIVDGRFGMVYGFKPIRSERLNTDGSSYRQVVCWVKDAVIMADSGIEMHLDTDINANHNKVFTAYHWLGMSRLEEEGVVEIKCDEAA